MTTTTPPITGLSTRPAWLALPWTLLGFPLAMGAGFGIYAAFGLCMESSRETCGDSPWISWWQTGLVFVIAWMLLAGPSLYALTRGLRAHKSGNPRAMPVIVVSGVLIVLITVVLGSGLW